MCMVFVLHSTAAQLITEHEGVSRCNTRMYSSAFNAQNPALENVRQQSVKVYLHMYKGNVQKKPHPKDLPISPRFLPTMF